MTSFPTIRAMTAALARGLAAAPAAQRHAEEQAGHALVEAARREIGHESEAWAPLSAATMEGFEHAYGFRIPGKVELGFTGQVSATDPLLRTGTLRDSYAFQLTNRGLLLGSTSKEALWQEMGTPGARYPIPPRPVVGPVMFRHGHAAAGHIARSLMAALFGQPAPAAPKF